MVNGTLEGLEPHACSGEKRNGSHTGCYEEVGEGGKALCWWVTAKARVVKHTQGSSICCQKQNTVPAFLIGAEMLLRVEGAVKEKASQDMTSHSTKHFNNPP